MRENLSLEEIIRRTAVQPDRIPFPDKLVGWLYIAKGVGEVVLHTLTDQLRHETPSEH